MVNKIVPDCHADRQEETVVVVSAAASCECKKGRGSTRGMGGWGVRPAAVAEHSGRNSTRTTGRATLLFCEPATTRRPDDTSRRCATTANRRSAVVLVSNCRIMLLLVIYPTVCDCFLKNSLLLLSLVANQDADAADSS